MTKYTYTCNDCGHVTAHYSTAIMHEFGHRQIAMGNKPIVEIPAPKSARSHVALR